MSATKFFLLAVLLVAAFAVTPSARYKEDSARRAKLPEGSNEVVFLGSSTIDYWKPFFPGRKFVNRGIHKETLRQFMARFDQDVAALKPKAVVFYGGSKVKAFTAGGGEDVKEEVERDFKKLHQLAYKQNMKVIQVSTNPVCGGKSEKRSGDAIVEVNNFLKKLCAESKDCVFADTYTALVNKKGELKKTLSKDCLHPNAKGYDIMNPIILKAIDEALSSTSKKTSTKSTKKSSNKTDKSSTKKEKKAIEDKEISTEKKSVTETIASTN
jgi:lysophospholipase L1-like esterase